MGKETEWNDNEGFFRWTVLVSSILLPSHIVRCSSILYPSVHLLSFPQLCFFLNIIVIIQVPSVLQAFFPLAFLPLGAQKVKEHLMLCFAHHHHRYLNISVIICILQVHQKHYFTLIFPWYTLWIQNSFMSLKISTHFPAPYLQEITMIAWFFISHFDCIKNSTLHTLPNQVILSSHFKTWNQHRMNLFSSVHHILPLLNS